MVETVKTEAALLAQMADGGDNTAEEVRDNIVSGWTPGWVRYLDHRLPDETAHVDDDFFKSDSSADYTEQTVSGSATWTIERGLLSVEADGQTSGDAAAYLKAITSASAPMTIETRVRLLVPVQASNTFGIGFTDGTGTSANVAWTSMFDGTSAGARLRAGTLTDWFTDVNVTVATLAVSAWVDVYTRCVWTAANTFAGSWSRDGVTWIDWGATTFSKTMTPTHFGFIVGSQSGAEVFNASFDYFRVYDADLSV